MAVKKRSDLARPYEFHTWRDLTPMNSSVGPQLHNLTGAWRYIKPIFEDKTPACQNACPAGNDIETWIGLVQKREYEQAYWHLKLEQPFPAVLGRVCFKFCQGACNRGALDKAVQINELERFVGDRVDPSEPHPFLPPVDGPSLAVVGSGPAGMSAAYFARCLGFSVTIFEARAEPGGLLRLGIPAYRLPREIVAAEFSGLKNMGVELKTGVSVGRDLGLDELCSNFDYVFLATGVKNSLPLGLGTVPEGARVISGLDLLRQTALGGPPDLGRRVVVIGGGNTAVDAARTAVRLGSEVTVIYRRSENEMPAHPEEVREAREEGVVFHYLAAPEKLECRADGGIDQLVCAEMELGEPDESGRPRPIKKQDARFQVEADAIISAIGERADLDYLAGLVSNDGRVITVDPGLRAETGGKYRAGVFAGGDVIKQPHTVVHAVAAGKRAALAMDADRRGLAFGDIVKKITIGTSQALSFSMYMGWTAGDRPRLNLAKVVDSSQMVYDYFREVPPVEKEAVPPEERRENFLPHRTTFDKADARLEARRCLHCGRCTECDNCRIFCPDVSILKKGPDKFGYSIDYDYCKGCGICMAECPRQAVTMVDERTVIEEEDN